MLETPGAIRQRAGIQTSEVFGDFGNLVCRIAAGGMRNPVGAGVPVSLRCDAINGNRGTLEMVEIGEPHGHTPGRAAGYFFSRFQM
jgi:hypothetical protein